MKMRTLIFLAALAFALPAAAQSNDKNLQGADSDGSKLDPASKARVRTEGAAGGIEGGAKDASAGETNRRQPKDKGKGRVHDEKSSDREASRGARGR
jgi:hypothetical protein